MHLCDVHVRVHMFHGRQPTYVMGVISATCRVQNIICALLSLSPESRRRRISIHTLIHAIINDVASGQTDSRSESGATRQLET